MAPSTSSEGSWLLGCGRRQRYKTNRTPTKETAFRMNTAPGPPAADDHAADRRTDGARKIKPDAVQSYRRVQIVPRNEFRNNCLPCRPIHRDTEAESESESEKQPRRRCADHRERTQQSSRG